MRLIFIGTLCIAAIALAGCFSNKNAGPLFRAGDEQMPEFLGGPAVVLLTNFPGYSARLDTDIRRPYSQSVVAGPLLHRNGRLVFQPEEIVSKKRAGAGMIFIWDANLKRGWAVSEALQGYAPVTPPVEITAVEYDAEAPFSINVNGHPCHQTRAKVTRADGSIASYRIWQADDLRHFPVRIQSDSGGKPMTLNFSEIRLESPGEQLFNPPDGFVKYNSPVALMNELIIRETTVGQRTEPTEVGPLPANPANIYQPPPATPY